jgi:SAM-dependent methyltransferase
VLTVDFERMHVEPGATVLDLGCGAGRHSRGTRRFPGVAVAALDLGEKETRDTAATLRECDALAPEQGGSVPAAGPWLSIRGSAYDLPFGDGAFDFVIASEVLEHLYEDGHALREIRRVLRAGGMLAISVPREGPERVCWMLSKEYHDTPGGHVRVYQQEALRKLLVAQGFRIVGRHFAHALHSPFWWMRCAIGPSNDTAWPVRIYHRFLVWDLMARPWLTRTLENVLNPLIGKSLVFYAVRP